MPILGEVSSRWFLSYYFGPDHPGKLRLLRALMRVFALRVLSPYQGRARISLDLTDGVQDSIARYGAYEPEVWDALAGSADRDEIVWDIGANIGGVAIRAGLDSRVREVHAFEAHPASFRVLKHNLKLNQGRLFAHGFALGAERGDARICFGDRGNCGGASLRHGRGRLVRVLRADDVVDASLAPPPTLIKLDVEDWELPVLQGARELFARHPPKAVVFEAKAAADGTLGDDEIRAFFESRGYAIRHIPRAYSKVEAVENYLATRVASPRAV